MYYENRAIEESTVQFLAEEICKVEGIPVVVSKTYEKWVNILKDFNKKINVCESELQFAQELIGQSIENRIDWLKTKAHFFLINQVLQVIFLS